MFEPGADHGEEIGCTNDRDRQRELERRYGQVAFAEQRPVECEHEAYARRRHRAPLESQGEPIAKRPHDEPQRLDGRRSPLELDALFGHLGGAPRVERRGVFSVEELHHVFRASTEPRTQRALRETLEIAAGAKAQVSQPDDRVAGKVERLDGELANRSRPLPRRDNEGSPVFFALRLGQARDRRCDARPVGDRDPTHVARDADTLIEDPRELVFASVKMGATADLEPYDVAHDVERCRGTEGERHFGYPRQRRADRALREHPDVQSGALRARGRDRLTHANPERASFSRHDVEPRIAKDVARRLHGSPGPRDDDAACAGSSLAISMRICGSAMHATRRTAQPALCSRGWNATVFVIPMRPRRSFAMRTAISLWLRRRRSRRNATGHCWARGRVESVRIR